jgi:filamentous hemagglutinin family protein
MPRLVETRPFDSDVIRRLGAKPRVSISVLANLLGVVGLFSVPVLAQTTGTAPVSVAATQLPTGGQVNAGQATISQSGNTLNVNQTSQKAVVDWNTFNVGKDATVNFQQPNAQSSTLNRVTDTQPSHILGRITAPGSVVLVNPQGVYFGKSSSVDVGGLAATTHDITNRDFMDGQLKLARNGANGKVVNEGELRAALGGYIALLAPEVRNSGVIVANLGTVALAAGETFELKFDGSGLLSRVLVTAGSINTLVENKHAIKAPGGLIILSAQSASRLQSGVVNNSGTIEAAGLVRRGGRILLEASSSIVNSGAIKADATAGINAGPAGSVTLAAPDVQNSGTLSATNLAANSLPESGSLAAENGRISIQADTFTQTSTGLLDVSAVATNAGTVDITASQAMLVSGRIFANGVVSDPSQIVANALGGTIQLQTTTRAELTTAVLDASGEGGGGRIHIQADGVPTPINNPADNSNQMPIKGAVLLSTNTVLRANSARAHAGRVEVEGDHINLETATLIEAKGATKGGTVLIGGDWQGSGTLRQATTVTMLSLIHI